jgi:hypothetical protein
LVAVVVEQVGRKLSKSNGFLALRVEREKCPLFHATCSVHFTVHPNINMLYPCLLVVALAAVTVSAGPNAAGIAFLKENAEKEGVGTGIPFVVPFFLASS